MSNNSDLNKSKCRVVVDVMGGDYAPQNAVVGAINAFDERKNFELILVGKKEEVKKVIKNNNLTFNESNIVNADEVIEMGDSPLQSIKSKPNSSIVVGTNLVKENKADAFVSAGNTGAVSAASTLIMGRLEGIERPTIGTKIPSESGLCTVFDVGAFVDSKPQHLFGYAVMATCFVKEIYGIEKPTIGLLSVGDEEEKGNKLTKETFELLKKSKLNFTGNIEGKDVLKGKINIVLCDGFLGNILLKFGESFPGLLKAMLSQYAENSFLNKIKIGLLKNSIKEAMKPLDYEEEGGIPLLGVKGISIIGHGRSTPKAFKYMVFRAVEIYDKNIVDKIEKSIKNYIVN
jgi:glycerol-3-phosphate acyltransferase PlsX